MRTIWRRKYDKIQIGKKEYRIEFNWLTLTNFMERNGFNFGQLEILEKLNPIQFISLLYEGILEGCSIEKKQFPYSLEDFSAMLTPESINQLSMIFRSQNELWLKGLQKIS